MKHKDQTISELIDFFNDFPNHNNLQPKKNVSVKNEKTAHKAKMKSILEKLERKHNGL